MSPDNGAPGNPGPVRVLFICTGNICRSPMAEAVFRHLTAEAGLADRIEVRSAGTGDWHLGEPPDPGTQVVLAAAGIPWGDKRAERLTPALMASADYVVVMDRRNLRALPPGWRRRARLLLSWAPDRVPTDEVPDPYYNRSFDRVYRLMRPALEALFQEIKAELPEADSQDQA